MKTNPTNNDAAACTDRDTALGKSLSGALAKLTHSEPCPPIEELAAMKDGTLAGAERDRLLRHMSVCDRCREIFVMVHSLSQEDPVRKSRAEWYVAGCALAIAVTVALVIKITMPTPSGKSQQVASAPILQTAQAPVTTKAGVAKAEESTLQRAIVPVATFNTAQAARMLAKSATPDNLGSAVGASSKIFGFAGASRKSTVFKAGQELLELELWLAAGDKERAELATVRLTPLIKSISGDAALLLLSELLRQLETNSLPKGLDDISVQLEAKLAAADRGILRLGSWAAAARVATGMGKDPYFGGNPPGVLLAELDNSVPTKTRKTLEKLATQKSVSDLFLFKHLLDELASNL
ncbi:MAG: zf-HC2 domain-containing protein [Pedobacter sp.]